MLTEAEKREYAERAKSLKEMGYTSYSDYLESPLWRSIRARALRPGAWCVSCGCKATQVHHTRYARVDLDGTCLQHLLPVCGPCHRRAEFSTKGEKLGPQRATAKLREMPIWRDGQQQKDAARHAWQSFFSTVDAMRRYLGMENSEEAQQLCAELDIARAALPAQRRKKRQKI